MSVLKYKRFPQESISTLIGGDKITAMGLTGRGFVLGCESGRVYIVSFAGKVVKRSSPHTKTVNSVSVDYDGMFFATCSDDGTVVLQSMHLKMEDQRYNLGEPVKCVVMQNMNLINNLASNKASVNSNGRFQGGAAIPKSSTKGEKDNNSRAKKICFIAGSASGMLSRYKASWFNQVHDVLFAGTGSAVSTIAWNGGDLIAWTDATQMKVMNISTMTAVCYLEAPDGVGVGALFPSSLVWVSETDLYVAWADSFRHLEIQKDINQGNRALDKLGRSTTEIGGGAVARTITEWLADFIICGVSNFDSEHLALLGYAPPERDQVIGTEASTKGGNGDEGGPDVKSGTGAFNQPEVQIVNRKTGIPVFVDVLPMLGSAIKGPWSYMLLSSYHVHLAEIALAAEAANSPLGGSSDDGGGNSEQQAAILRDPMIGMRSTGDTSNMWNVANLLGARGGARGHDPILYIMAPEDFVVGRVITVDDRIRRALSNKELRVAAEIAVADRAGLRSFKFVEVLTLYINDLLAGQQEQLAATECLRLFRDDPILWEQWVYSFAKADKLHAICDVIPTESPRLPLVAYELCIEELLHTRVYHPGHFLLAVRRWAPIRPSVIDTDALILRLRGLREAHPYFQAALGVLYIQKQEFEQAIKCSLDAAGSITMSGGDVGELRLSGEKRVKDEEELLRLYRSYLGEGTGDTDEDDDDDDAIRAARHKKELGNNKKSSGASDNTSILSASSKTGLDAPSAQQDFGYIFTTIEASRLHPLVADRILDLVRLDRARAIAFLIRSRDAIPVALVVQALRGSPSSKGSSSSRSSSSSSGSSGGDRYGLYWYLHLTFVLFPETYNTLHFAEFHVLQVSLYAEFTPKTALRNSKRREGEKAGKGEEKGTSLVNAAAASLAGSSGTETETVKETESAPAPLDRSLFPSRDLFSVASEASSSSSSSGGGVGDSGSSMSRSLVREGPSSFFLYFLRNAHLVPLALALKESEARQLHNEIIYIHAKMGRLEAALSMLLERTGDVLLAVDFVETFQGSSSKGGPKGGEGDDGMENIGSGGGDGGDESTRDRGGVDESMDSGQSIASIATASSLSGGNSSMGGALWKLILGYCQNDATAMSDLLKVVGVCHLNPAHVIKRIPDRMKLPELRGRMLRIHSLRDFKSFVTDRCNDILAEDTVGLQRRLNQLQRRSVKVSPRELRCMACSRPLFVPGPTAAAAASPPSPDQPTTPGARAASFQDVTLLDGGGVVPSRHIWGPAAHVNAAAGVVVFSPREAYHISCYTAMGEQVGQLHAG